MSKEKQMIEERLELSDIIDYAIRDWDDYVEECHEEGNPPIDTFEEYIADAVIGAGYRKQSDAEWVRVMNHKECSKCGYNAPYKKIKAGYHLQDLAKFCPNCGAKMKGGE